MPELAIPLVVWGGGTGGVAAALQAARRGIRTLLLTPGPWLGGMVSAAGVCCPDGNELTPWQTGLWGAFLRELGRREPNGLDHNWVSCFGYQPATAEAILRHWLDEAPALTWWPGTRLRAVRRQGERISALEVEREHAAEGGPHTLVPDLMIDGSDRGELIALAGAAHRLGWEAQELWDEPSAPAAARLASEPFFARQPVQSPTWVAIGRLDRQRPCPTPGSPLPEPFSQATAAFGLERTITYGRLPNDRVMLNWPLAGNDWHSGLERAFAADPEAATSGEVELFAAMQEHSLQFGRALAQASDGWLQLDGLFPAAEAAGTALTGPSPLALMPYWREGRRLVGLATMIEQHLLPQGPGATIAALPERQGVVDAVVVGNYANDHHYPGADWPLAPKSCRWGGRWSGTPFCIPYGALVSADTANLLAADKGFSVSHMANGATRLQPQILNVGQAAGMAAALCLQQGCRPAELAVADLQRALIVDPLAPAGPFPLWDTPWHHPAWRHRQLAVLADPSLLLKDGTLPAVRKRAGDLEADALPDEAPPERGERLWAGVLQGRAEGGYQLAMDGGAGNEGAGGDSWPLITLEPALHHWLAQASEGPVRLIGTANPWGPWLRVSRLAP
ncbi:MAG: FAD-dependent oxidoreductase [Cyanobacteria bacterium M_surface_10_m2_119]|nr:FAD-dependent oxidoreductase [Cyanobacteria bacterium M_surface_10_m2_119]